MPLEFNRSFCLFVTHVEGEGQFLKICGQLDQPSSLMLHGLSMAAHDYFERGIGSVPPEAIQDGIICVAKYKYGGYFRARIICTKNLSNGVVGVYFIDYGNKDMVSVQAVRFLDNYDPMFLQLPGLAHEYYLARVTLVPGRWAEHLLQKLRYLLYYADYPATVEGETQTLPIISLVYNGTDLSSQIVENKLEDLPVARQNFMLAHSGGEVLQATNWQQNFMVPHSSYTGHVPIYKSPNRAPGACLQQNVSVRFKDAMVPPLSGTSQVFMDNNLARDMMNLRAHKPPSRQLQAAPNFPPILERIPTPAVPATDEVSLSPKKTNSYKSHRLEYNSEHEASITFVENGPELFTVQLYSSSEKFQNMMESINKIPHTRLKEPPMIGSVCLGRLAEGYIFCRCIVINLSSSQCKLHFVDLGDTEMVSYDDVFEIPEEYMKEDVFGYKFCLSGVNKLPKSQYLNEKFKKLVANKLLKLRVVTPEGPPVIQYGELYMDNKNVLDLLLASMKFKRMDKLQLGSGYSVLVSYVDSCLKFYVQLSDQIDDLKSVMDAVHAHCESTSSPGKLPVGTACCAKFPEDGNWYRALVHSTKDNKVVVAYVDYGNEQEVAVSDLRTITPDLVKLPAQALKCALKGFENIPIRTKTSDLLEKLALEKTFIAKNVAVLFDDTMLVTLIDDTVSPPLDVAQEINKLLQPRIIPEINTGARPKVGRERGRDQPEDSDQREGNWRNRENKDPVERIVLSSRRDKSENLPDHRSRLRCDKMWKAGAPIVDWREALEWRRPARDNSDSKLNKQDERENKPERTFGAREWRGERFKRREPSAQRRKPGADKGAPDRGGDQTRDRAPPHKPHYRELAEPVPLDTPFAEPAVEVGSQHEVAVTWIISPLSFFAQILSDQPKFLEMMHRIPELYKGVRPYGGPVGVGASVLARYPADGVLYRATVVAVQPFSKFVVQYVDFGNKQLVDAKDIWQLERQLTELPKMAVHCRLLGVAPKEAEWKADPEVDLCFNAPRYQCVFTESADGQQRVSLWNNGASVADALVDKGLAVRADPPAAVTLKDEAVDLTIIVGQQIPCRVTHVHSFDKFYVQLDLEKAALVEQAVAGLDAAQLTPLAPDSLVAGVHCTVRHEGRVYRAILEDAADAARVAAVLPDYGRSITTSLDNLTILPTELGVYYYQSLQCCLNNYTAESRRLVSEDGLKTRLVDNKFIVYIDSVEGISLVTTLYDMATGQKLALFEPDEGAFPEVAPLCPRTVLNYNFGLASVQHLESLDEIHLQRSADVGRVQALLDSLFAFYEEGSAEPLTEFAADTLCAAKSADENWYRAVIVSASEEAATVQFPDYGNSEVVPKTLLKKLDPRFHEPCAQALEVGLGLETLQETAPARLAEWVGEREVQVTLAFGPDGWLASLHLDGVDLAMRLVEEKLAAPRAAGAEEAESVEGAAAESVEGAAAESVEGAAPKGAGQWSEAVADSFAELVGDTEAPVDAPIVLKDVTTYVDLFVAGENLTDRLVAQGHAARAEQPECGDLPECFTSHVNSPSEFWIQLESAAPELQAMEAAMVDADRFPALESREEGVLCAAKYPEDEAWYRAQVIVDGSEGTEVLFMDYGNASIATELRSLPADLKDKPALSRKCALQKPRDIKFWSRKSENKFNDLAAEGATVFKVQFIASGDISTVELYVEGRSVTEQLLGLCEELTDPEGERSVEDVDLTATSEASNQGTEVDITKHEPFYTNGSEALQEETHSINEIENGQLVELVTRASGSITVSNGVDSATLMLPSNDEDIASVFPASKPVIIANVSTAEVEFTATCDTSNQRIVTEIEDLKERNSESIETDNFEALQEEIDSANKMNVSVNIAESVAQLETDKSIENILTDNITVSKVKLNCNDDNITSVFPASKFSESAHVNVSTGEEFSATSETANQHVDSETGDIKEANSDTIETDNLEALLEKIDTTNKIDITVTVAESVAQLETDKSIENILADNITISKVELNCNDDNVTSVFPVSKFSESAHVNVSTGEEFSATSETANQHVDSETGDIKEANSDTIETDNLEALLEMIDTTNKIDISVTVAESVAQLETDKSIENILADNITISKVELNCNDDNVTSVFPVSKFSEFEDINVSRGEEFSATSETSNQHIDSETGDIKETNSETIETDNLEALQKEIGSTNKTVREHMTLAVLLTDTDKAKGTVFTDSITVSKEIDLTTLTSDDEDITSYFYASKPIEPEIVNVSTDAEEFTATSEPTNQGILNVKEDLKKTIDNDYFKASPKEMDSTNKIENEQITEFVAHLIDNLENNNTVIKINSLETIPETFGDTSDKANQLDTQIKAMSSYTLDISNDTFKTLEEAESKDSNNTEYTRWRRLSL